MTPDDINNLYNDLAQTPQNTATQATTELGQSQAAAGPSLAAMGASGGNGIGNYTYNRLIDPTVGQLSTQLVTTGRSQALNRAISLAQAQAQERYRNAYNNYANRQYSGGGSGGGSGGDGNGNGGDGTIAGVQETTSNDQPPTTDVNKDVRLNYDENGNLISGSLPGTTQDFDYQAMMQQDLKNKSQAAWKQQQIEQWKKDRPFSPLPSWLK